MIDRITKNRLAQRQAQRMKSDESTVAAWIDGVAETFYESLNAGESVTIPGLGGFYVRPEPQSWVFTFNPAQRLRALFGWSSTSTGKRSSFRWGKESRYEKAAKIVDVSLTQNHIVKVARNAEARGEHQSRCAH